MTQALRHFGEASFKRAIRGIYIPVLLLLASSGGASLFAQIVTNGAGAYTTSLPGGAVAPQSTIYTTVPGPVATHKYWSSKLWTPLNNGGYNIIPQPLFTSILANGMEMGIHGDLDGYPADDGTATAFYQYPQFDLTIGNANLNASAVNISASSDWSADFNFGPSLTLRTGRGMPFVYALTDGTPLTVTFARTPTIMTNNTNVLLVSTPEGDTRYTNYYGLFCPTGGTWAQSGQVFTCQAPSGANYASVALLPGVLASPNGNPANLNQTTLAQQLSDFTKVAFSFPTNTQVSWSYNEASSQVTTTYTITTKSMDGTSTGFLSALYPTQYNAMPTAVNTAYTYLSNHGVMEVNSGTSFTTVDTFHGILPFMPPTANYSLPTLKGYVDSSPAAALSASDYEQGKILGAAAQVLPLASLSDPAAYTTLQSDMQNILQTWFTASSGATADLFYYDSTWGTLIGYPASFDSDDQINDHHFHYGYFIHSSAMNGLFNPSWVTNANYGGMVRLLQQDIANYDRTNTMFPFLRHFDVYGGHSWASGTAPFADGENEESSSEAVNAWTGMILLGAATGDTQLRDAGIWLYTQETKGVAYYWFNEKPAWVNANAASTFPTWFAPLRVANQYDDKGDEATFFGTEPDYEHAIEFLPFTGGSFHLGLSPTYVEKNYQEDVAANAAWPAANGGAAPGEWPDLMEEYEALADPETAWTQWQGTTAATDGDTLAHEYAWITSLRDLGQVVSTVTANTPFYQVFKLNGTTSHVAFNPSSSPITVTFSDGASLVVPASTMNSDNPLVTSFTFGSGVVTAQPPATPTNVVATAKSSSEIDLSWTLVSGVTYTVYGSTTSGFVPAPGNVVASGLTAASYANTGLVASTAYFYVVEAVNSGGNSAPSTQVTATTNTGTSGGGTAVPESGPLYLVGGATAATPSLLSFTAGNSGVDTIPANVVQEVGTPTNPLVYTVTGVSGTYNPAATTNFNMYVDAGTNPGEAVQVEVLYDPTGSGTFTRTETSSLFATNAAVDYEDYQATSRGPVTTTGSLTNMVNGTIQIKIWMALPGVNDAPIYVTTGNNSDGASDLVIPFTSITQTLLPAVAPASLTATDNGPYAINLSWPASSTPGVSYSLFRSFTSGFTPGASNMIASGITATSYSDINLAASSTYYYVVEAVNALGSSAASAQATATTAASNGPIPGSNTLYLQGGATLSTPSALTFTAGAAGADNIPVNNPQSPDVVADPLIYTITGINGTYDSSMVTDFSLFIDAGTNPGEAAQVEVLYDLTGSGTYSRTELYHYFGTDPVVGFEDYQQNSRGGLETATGSLGDMTNGTVTIEVWNALPGPNAANMTLSVGNNPNSVSNVVIPYSNVTQTPPGPAAPTALTATAISSSQINLAWTASTTNSVTYNVYRSTTSGFKPSAATLLGNTASLTYSDTGLNPVTAYYYIVSSVNAAGSTPSLPATATTQGSPTSVALTLSAPTIFLNGTETLTATVSPTAATGTMTFKDGSATLGTGTLSSGVATYTTGALTGGSHSFTASYSGDSLYAPSVSPAVPLTVPLVPPDFAFTASPTSTIVGAGQTASYTLSVSSQGNFASAVSFSCSGLPSLATCTFNPASVTPSPTTAATSTLSIATTGNSKKAMLMPRGVGKTGFLALLPACFGLLCFAGKKRRVLRRLMAGTAMLTVLCCFTACSTTTTQTPTSITTVTITATSGSDSHSTTVTLDVQDY